MTLGKLLHLPGPWLTHLLNGRMINLSCLTFTPGGEDLFFF